MTVIWPKCADGHPYDPDRFRCLHPSHFCQRETCHHDKIVHHADGCFACREVWKIECAAFVAYAQYSPLPTERGGK